MLTHCSSICVYGEDLARILPPGNPGPESVVVAYEFKRVYQESAEPFRDVANVKLWHCRRTMKFMVQIGFEIVMEHEQAWTRDLNACYAIFGTYYPEQEPQMREVLELALTPVADPQIVLPIIEDLGPWLVEQVDVWLKRV